MFRFTQERAEAAEAKVEELQAELKAGEADNEVQMEAAGSAHAETEAELREATDALREEIERPALAEAKLSELQSELARADESERRHADSLRKAASMEAELEAPGPRTAAISGVSDSLDRLATLPSPLSTGLTPAGEGMPDPPADTVIRLQGDDPVMPPAFPAASGASQTEDPESDQTGGWSSQEGSEEERDGSDRSSHGGPLGNRHR